jgi:DNA-binding MarR family transcriptional regulator/biotin operon repressor
MNQVQHSEFDANAAYSTATDKRAGLSGAGFEACPGNAGTVAPPPSSVAPKPGRALQLRTKIMDILADGKPRRASDVVARIGEGVTRATVWREIYALKAAGRVVRLRQGIWVMTEMAAMAMYEIASPQTEYFPSHTERRVLERLSRPIAAADMIEELGLSRQRIYQVLQRLRRLGQVKRDVIPGLNGRWLWMRPDDSVENAILPPRPFPRASCEILNCLEPDAFHWFGDVAQAVPRTAQVAYAHIKRLEARGLVTIVPGGRHKFVSITPRGLDHPERSTDRPKAAKSNVSNPFQERLLAFVEALAVLGEAKTIDVTAAIAGADRKGMGLWSGQIIARLMQQGLAEAINTEPVHRPAYRLTEAGRSEASRIARLRPAPARQHLEERIAAYRTKRGFGARPLRSKNRPEFSGMARSPAQQAILDALAAGPLPATAIRAVVSSHVAHSNGAYLMLRRLNQRGAVERIGMQGRVTVWSLRRTAGPASENFGFEAPPVGVSLTNPVVPNGTWTPQPSPLTAC